MQVSLVLCIGINIKTHPNEEQFDSICSTLDLKFNSFHQLAAELKKKI
jgi:hypothetical protein